MSLLLALDDGVVRIDLDAGTADRVLTAGPVTSIAADRSHPGCAYATTWSSGLWRTVDDGASWRPCGRDLDGHQLTRVSVSPSTGEVYVGTEPSALYKSEDRGRRFVELGALHDLPSRPEWSFPPRPGTSHVWTIAISPVDPQELHVGIELGGIVSSFDGGRTWRDRQPGADYDCHTLRMHREVPHRLYEAGGACYCRSEDPRSTWERDLDGIPEDLRYFYSMAVDPGNPETVLMTAARDPFHGHYNSNASDAWGTAYGRHSGAPWQPLDGGFPSEPGTPMGWFATDDRTAGMFVYVTPRAHVHRSTNGGRSWQPVPWDGDGDGRRIMVRGAELTLAASVPDGADDLGSPEALEATERLRFSALALAGPPSSQRRWVQLGMLQRACGILEQELSEVPVLAEQGAVSDQQAQLISGMGERYLSLRAASDDLLDEARSEKRSFLWSDALESPQWRELRRAARQCYDVLSVGKDPIIDG